MKETLVIGYGNTLRGDDAAGIRAAEALADKLPGVACVCTHELGIELSETIAGCDDVFFLDASTTTGRLICRPLRPAAAPDAPGSHTLTPDTLLFYCKQLYQRLPWRSTLIEIPAFQFEVCEKMSAVTTRMVHECVDAVATLIQAGAAGADPR